MEGPQARDDHVGKDFSTGVARGRGQEPGAPTTAASADTEREPLEIVRSLISDLQLLFQKHVELARQELLEALEARIKALAAGAVAGVMALFALGFLASAVAFALDLMMPAWLSRLIVAGGFLLITALAGLFGRRRLAQPPMAPEATMQALKEDTEWARDRLGR